MATCIYTYKSYIHTILKIKKNYNIILQRKEKNHLILKKKFIVLLFHKIETFIL